jgi:hypothetical protein
VGGGGGVEGQLYVLVYLRPSRNTGTHQIGGCVGPRVSVDVFKKKKKTKKKKKKKTKNKKTKKKKKTKKTKKKTKNKKTKKKKKKKKTKQKKTKKKRISYLCRELNHDFSALHLLA